MQINQVFPDEYRVSETQKDLCNTARFVGGVSQYLCECKNPKTCKGVIRTSIDADIEAGRVFTRKDYLDGKIRHHHYYKQFVTDATRRMVLNHIGETAIIESIDAHFNDIPLRRWDMLNGIVQDTIKRDLWKACNNVTYDKKHKNDFLWSLSDAVCIAKTAAHEIRKEKGTPRRYAVQVRFKDTDDTITTEINGTPESIQEYYEKGKVFNLGAPQGGDRMETVKEVRFI